MYGLESALSAPFRNEGIINSRIGYMWPSKTKENLDAMKLSNVLKPICGKDDYQTMCGWGDGFLMKLPVTCDDAIDAEALIVSDRWEP